MRRTRGEHVVNADDIPCEHALRAALRTLADKIELHRTFTGTGNAHQQKRRDIQLAQLRAGYNILLDSDPEVILESELDGDPDKWAQARETGCIIKGECHEPGCGTWGPLDDAGMCVEHG